MGNTQDKPITPAPVTSAPTAPVPAPAPVTPVPTAPVQNSLLQAQMQQMKQMQHQMNQMQPQYTPQVKPSRSLYMFGGNNIPDNLIPTRQRWNDELIDKYIKNGKQ